MAGLSRDRYGHLGLGSRSSRVGVLGAASAMTHRDAAKEWSREAMARFPVADPATWGPDLAPPAWGRLGVSLCVAIPSFNVAEMRLCVLAAADSCSF